MQRNSFLKLLPGLLCLPAFAFAQSVEWGANVANDYAVTPNITYLTANNYAKQGRMFRIIIDFAIAGAYIDLHTRRRLDGRFKGDFAVSDHALLADGLGGRQR